MDDQKTNRDSGIRGVNRQGLGIVAAILGLLMVGRAIVSGAHPSSIGGGLLIGGILIIALAIIAAAMTRPE